MAAADHAHDLEALDRGVSGLHRAPGGTDQPFERTMIGLDPVVEVLRRPVLDRVHGLRPDFKTIADFRKDNRHAFKPVFRQFVLLCRKLDLFGRELLAVDGTRLKAVNSTDRNFTCEKLVTMIRSADERLADYLSRLDRTDAEEDGTSGRPAKNLTEKIAALKERKTRHEGLLEELERSGDGAVSSSRNARPIPIGGLAAGPRRRCSSAWRHGWRPDPRF